MPWPPQTHQKPPRGIVANLLYKLIGDTLNAEGFQQTSSYKDPVLNYYNEILPIVRNTVPAESMPNITSKLDTYYTKYIDRPGPPPVTASTTSTTSPLVTASRTLITVKDTNPPLPTTSPWDKPYKLFRLITFDPRLCDLAVSMPEPKFSLNRNVSTEALDSNTISSVNRIYKSVGVLTIRLEEPTRFNGYTLNDIPTTNTWMLMASNDEGAFDDLADDVETYMARLSTQKSNWQELDRFPKQLDQDTRSEDKKTYQSYSQTSMSSDYEYASRVLNGTLIAFLQGVYNMLSPENRTSSLNQCNSNLKSFKQNKLFSQRTSGSELKSFANGLQTCISDMRTGFVKQVQGMARSVLSFAEGCSTKSETASLATSTTDGIQVDTFELKWSDVSETASDNILNLSLQDAFKKYDIYIKAYRVLVEKVAPPNAKKTLPTAEEIAALPTIPRTVFALPPTTSDSYATKVFNKFQEVVLKSLENFYISFTEDSDGLKVGYMQFYSPEFIKILVKMGNATQSAIELNADEVKKTSYPMTLYKDQQYATSLLRLKQIFETYQDLTIRLIADKTLAKEKQELFKMVDVFTYYFDYIKSQVPDITFPNAPSQFERDKLKQSLYTLNKEEVSKEKTTYTRLLYADVTSSGTVSDLVGVLVKMLREKLNYFKTISSAEYKGEALSTYYIKYEKDQEPSTPRFFEKCQKNVDGDLSRLSDMRLKPTLRLINDDANSYNILQLDQLIYLYTSYSEIIKRIDDTYYSTAIADVDLDNARNAILSVIQNYIDFASLVPNLDKLADIDIPLTNSQKTNAEFNQKTGTNFSNLPPSPTPNFDITTIRPSDLAKSEDIKTIENLTPLDKKFQTDIDNMNEKYKEYFKILNNYIKNRTIEAMIAYKYFTYLYPPTLSEFTYTDPMKTALASVKTFGTRLPNTDLNALMSITDSADSMKPNISDIVNKYLEALQDFSIERKRFDEIFTKAKGDLGILIKAYFDAYNLFVSKGLLTVGLLDATPNIINLTTVRANASNQPTVSTDITTMTTKYKDAVKALFDLAKKAKTAMYANYEKDSFKYSNFFPNSSFMTANRYVDSSSDASTALLVREFKYNNDAITDKLITPLNDPILGTQSSIIETGTTESFFKEKIEPGKTYLASNTDLENILKDTPIITSSNVSTVSNNLTDDIDNIKDACAKIEAYIKSLTLQIRVGGKKHDSDATFKVDSTLFTITNISVFDTLDYFLVGGGGGGGGGSEGGGKGAGGGGGGSGLLNSSMKFIINGVEFPIRNNKDAKNATDPLKIQGNPEITLFIGRGGQGGGAERGGNAGNNTVLNVGTSLTRTANGGEGGWGAGGAYTGQGGWGFNGGGPGHTARGGGYINNTPGQGYGGDSGGTARLDGTLAGAGSGGAYGGGKAGVGGWGPMYSDDGRGWSAGNYDSAGGGGGGGVGNGHGGRGAQTFNREGNEGSAGWGWNASGAGGGGGSEWRTGGGVGGTGWAWLVFSLKGSLPFDTLKIYAPGSVGFTNPTRGSPSPSPASINSNHYPTFNPNTRTTEFVKPPPINTPRHTFKPATCVYQQPVARSYQNTQQADWATVWSQQALQTRAAASQMPQLLQPQPLSQQQPQPLHQQQQQSWDRACPKPRVVPQQDPQKQKPKNAPLYQQGASLDAAFGGSLLT